MKQKRLLWLLAVLVVMLCLRVFAPGQDSQPETAEAVIHIASPVTTGEILPSIDLSGSQRAAAEEPSKGTLATVEQPGNAFAVRTPPPPIAPLVPVLAPVPVRVVSVVAPPMEPPDPGPGLRVIGTWDDGKSPGVFITTPYGTLLAHKGDLLQSQYRVTDLTRQLLSIQNVASMREYKLAIPR